MVGTTHANTPVPLSSISLELLETSTVFQICIHQTQKINMHWFNYFHLFFFHDYFNCERSYVSHFTEVLIRGVKKTCLQQSKQHQQNAKNA